ncbi:MAG TPA: SPFH domain-containing protein [Kiritimatiellia bacterium]|nr:SPFH domain-containing protein [Kiritimatiellia bacterium]
MNKLKPILGIVLFSALAVFVWQWFFCRFYVEPNQMAVIINKTGDPLPPGQILADPGQKGVQANVLGEGRHFLDPIRHERKILPAIIIPPGKIGLVTSKIGEELPPGEFLAEEHQKGIWRRVLGPGKYRMNPFGYDIQIVDAISIPIGYVGVVTSLSGEQAEPGSFAEARQKGVRRDILQPGLYFVNPKEYKVDVLEIGVNQVSLLGREGGEVITKTTLTAQNRAMERLQSNVLEQQRQSRLDYLAEAAQSVMRMPVEKAPTRSAAEPGAKARGVQVSGEPITTLGLAQYVEFPSRDGFEISLDMTVEFELLPDYIASIFSGYGDLPAVVDKVIMPQITSISRNKGSEYRAKDFIVGEGREIFQTELTRTLAATLKSKNIIVHNALIRHVGVPMQILDPIQQASIAIEQDLTNKEKQNTARKQAELNTELTLIEQRRQQVAQETSKIKAEIEADQQKQVAEIQAEALRRVADIARETASIRAERVRKLGRAEADAIKLVEGEKANGLLLKAQAFGDPQAFALWEFAHNLNPAITFNILHAGTGTLWTDLEKARLSDLGGAGVITDKSK